MLFNTFQQTGETESLKSRCRFPAGCLLKSVIDTAVQATVLASLYDVLTDAGLVSGQLSTTIPRNWMPVSISPVLAQIRLQKAGMPEFITRYSGSNSFVPSRRSLLRATQSNGQFFINREEVPRAGAVVRRLVNRIRWYNGRTFTGVGNGRGEGSSGLSFDQLHA